LPTKKTTTPNPRLQPDHSPQAVWNEREKFRLVRGD
jgi:hypothetical protein